MNQQERLLSWLRVTNARPGQGCFTARIVCILEKLGGKPDTSLLADWIPEESVGR